VRHVLWLALPLIFVIQASAAPCPSFGQKDESTLLRLEQTWAKALETRDEATVACLLAPEFEDADVYGAVHQRDKMLAHIQNRKPSLNHLEDMHAHIYGDAACVRGLNRVTYSSGKELAKVRFTDIFVYRGGTWQAVAGHETLVVDQPN